MLTAGTDVCEGGAPCDAPKHDDNIPSARQVYNLLVQNFTP